MLRFIVLSFVAICLFAQDRIGSVQVRVSTDRPDWRYTPGQPVRFKITAIRDGHVLSGVYSVDPNRSRDDAA